MHEGISGSWNLSPVLVSRSPRAITLNKVGQVSGKASSSTQSTYLGRAMFQNFAR
jgi:hypothetical protein